MTIGIDANWLIYESAGIGKYSYNIILEMLKNDRKNRYILFANFIKHFSRRKKILEDIVSQSGNRNVEIYISKVPSAWREWLTANGFPLRWLYRKNIDWYFSTYSSGIAKNGFSRQIAVIYDLVFMLYPEHAGQKLSNYYLNRTKNALEKCQKIVAISNSTKNDLVSKLGIECSKITVVYPGLDSLLFYPQKMAAATAAKAKFKITNPYILSVCTLEPRKNLERLLDAFKNLPADIQNKYQLVLVGKSGWNNQVLKSTIKSLSRAKSRDQKSKIIETGYVSDSELPYLYSGAELFVYPSLYEGFGLPPLEAMACGCPVIVSGNSSLPEVVGDAGVLVDATNVNDLTKAMAGLLTDEKRRLVLREKGLVQAKKFSWKDSALKIIDLFE